MKIDYAVRLWDFIIFGRVMQKIFNDISSASDLESIPYPVAIPISLHYCSVLREKKTWYNLIKSYSLQNNFEKHCNCVLRIWMWLNRMWDFERDFKWDLETHFKKSQKRQKKVFSGVFSPTFRNVGEQTPSF